MEFVHLCAVCVCVCVSCDHTCACGCAYTSHIHEMYRRIFSLLGPLTIARAFTLNALCSTVGHITLGNWTVDVWYQFCNKSSKIGASSNVCYVWQYVLAHNIVCFYRLE